MSTLSSIPVFGICGFSGAGKTTLILGLVRALTARGLRTVVLKHDAHGLTVDRRGKDTQRIFAAGADVLAQDACQTFGRWHGREPGDLEASILQLRPLYDVILVEGYKKTLLPRRIWLRRHARDRAPADCGPMALELGRDEDRAALTLRFLVEELKSMHASAPTLAGILMGGQSRRMGRSKHLLELGGQTWLARIVDAVSPAVDQVLLLGAGTVPPSCSGLSRLPDVPGCAGPVAGMRSALRFRPDAHWIFLACDAPLVSSRALGWLKALSAPGVLAVLPRIDREGAPQPMPGWYSPQVARILEAAAGPSALVAEPRTATPIVPAELTRSWWGCNTTAELRHLSRTLALGLPTPLSLSVRGSS